MPQPRTLDQKIGDTVQAFAVLRDEVTPPSFRGLINKLTEVPVGPDTDMVAYASLVQGSLHLARIIAGNDRNAMLAAAIITSSGVRTVPIPEEG